MPPEGRSERDKTAQAPGTSGAWLQYILRSLSGTGVDVASIGRDMGFDPTVDPEERIERDVSTSIWKEAARRTGDPLLGLRAAEQFRFGLNNILAHLTVSSENLGEALVAGAEYQTLLTAGTIMRLEARGAATAVVIDPFEGQLPVCHQDTDFIVGAIAQMMRTIANEPLPFAEVRFRHRCPKGDPAPYREFFECPVWFDASENSILIESVLLKVPAADRAAGLARRLETLAADDLALQNAASVSGQVEGLLARYLGAGEVVGAREESIARELHMSTRTLQRRLAEEGESFAVLIDAVRRKTAVTLLAEGLPTDVVARRLGYSNAATLRRAQRRWKTG